MSSQPSVKARKRASSPKPKPKPKRKKLISKKGAAAEGAAVEGAATKVIVPQNKKVSGAITFGTERVEYFELLTGFQPRTRVPEGTYKNHKRKTYVIGTATTWSVIRTPNKCTPASNGH
jgi:hypothetical protein